MEQVGLVCLYPLFSSSIRHDGKTGRHISMPCGDTEMSLDTKSVVTAGIRSAPPNEEGAVQKGIT